MKRARLVAFAAIALCGCRAVLGIETLTVDEDASVPTEDGAVNDAATDTTINPTSDGSIDSSIDAHHDAPPDRAPPPDGPSPSTVCVDAGLCQGCCRNTFGTAVEHLERYAIEAGCLCTNDASCAGVCDTTICAGNFAGNAGVQCYNCVDPAIGPGNLCSGDVPKNECSGDPQCVPYLECLGSCPH